MSKVDEAGFESFICDFLVSAGGYAAAKVGTAQGAPTDFDPVRGLDTQELFLFIGATQAEAWHSLRKLYGDPDKAQKGFVERLGKELDSRGTVDVLRHGVVDLGVTIRLAFFRPASGLTPELVERYTKNRLTVTRQLPYESGSTKTLDLCLFVNGIPVATVELKNAITGQGVDEAIEQYRVSRDPKNPLLRRAVVHFAVDTERVAMTTKLAGKATRFLPFNRGRDMGAGNPANPKGHRTSYLWEQVWPRDAWLDLLQRFVHVEPLPKGSRKEPTVVFPRFHQWDAVLALTAAAREHGAGADHLVQHSAGSGKSNTIAWLAHRLSSLHDATDTKVFDKVVVITDRRILDRQLQDTIYQFEHAHGVVVRIDQSSQQLADALAGEQARIIITTLQKFPFVTEKIEAIPNRTYAVIVDEAHSSQTGDSATALKQVLGAKKATDPDEPADPAEDELAAAVAARGRQPNLSFFAFTATPKARTLELFGRYDAATDRHVPFHLYSMRQAIEEGFILDVLASYVTYKTYWQIEQATPDDPQFDPKKAKAAIARFVSLHPHQLAQKAEVIVEHYRTKVRHRIGGLAKAMVVTASREHAARYKQALDTYINAKGYTDIGVLVAFSGSLDLDGDSFTEASMNGFPDTQTAGELDTDAYHLLVVAEKYQTGFDQPKLYAMYVDKPLTGLAAVQTLSRLNRTYDRDGIRKDGTFILDFRNEADDIRKAFEPYYGATVAPPTDPNLLYDTRHALDEFGVLWPAEVENAVSLLLAKGKIAHDRVHAALTPAIDRFTDLDDAEQERFREALIRFVRTYAFLSQVVSFTDAKLERDYLFCKALAAFIKVGGSEAVHPDVELTALKIEQTSEGSITLDETTGEVVTITGTGGKSNQLELELLSHIVDRLNERYGAKIGPEDAVAFYGSVFDKLTQRPDIQQAAAANTPENFKLVLQKEAMGGVLDQLSVSEDMALAYVDDPEMQAAVLQHYLAFTQGKAKVLHQELCDIVDLLGPDLESTYLEYKSTLRTHAESGETFKPLETATLKTIAAFLNSREGGTLLIGVADDGTVFGLESDYASRSKPTQDPRDWFQQHLANILSASVGDAAATNVRPHMHHVDGHDLCRVQVDPAGFPVEAKVIKQKGDGSMATTIEFYVRIGNGTKALNAVEREKYVAQRWGRA
jgi:type I restriction enzyme R subunit